MSSNIGPDRRYLDNLIRKCRYVWILIYIKRTIKFLGRLWEQIIHWNKFRGIFIFYSLKKISFNQHKHRLEAEKLSSSSAAIKCYVCRRSKQTHSLYAGVYASSLLLMVALQSRQNLHSQYIPYTFWQILQPVNIGTIKSFKVTKIQFISHISSYFLKTSFTFFHLIIIHIINWSIVIPLFRNDERLSNYAISASILKRLIAPNPINILYNSCAHEQLK